MKKQVKKLRLARETVGFLDDQGLKRAEGGEEVTVIRSHFYCSSGCSIRCEPQPTDPRFCIWV